MRQHVNIPSGNFFSSMTPQLPAPTGGDGKGGRGGRKPGKKFILRRIFDQWVDRLLGAVSEGSLSGAEEAYASHQTSRDFLWNTIGFTAWGMVFPLLTVVVTQISGVEQAGMFSLVYVAATLLMILANFGTRTFQISDVEEEHSFSEYQIHRFITCILMMVAGYLYCSIRGYAGDMFAMSMAVYAARMIDGLADVYEGRLQQMDKLYLAGVSLSVRSIASLVLFTLVLLITGNLVIASYAMAIVAFLSFLFVSAPLALLETPKSRKATLAGIISLFKQCAPLFIALFMYTLIDNMPKFVMEGLLSYDNQLYFNALYFPATAILMTVGFVYKPLLVRMANAWADVNRRKLFDLFIIGIVAVIVGITALFIFIMATVGIPLMSLMYGIDFEPFRQLSYVMMVAGGIAGVIDFLYQVITVLRKQQVVMKLYLITFGFSLFIPYMMISIVGLPGAALGYMIVLSILAVLLVMEYVKVRVGYARNPELEQMDNAPSAGERGERDAREMRGERGERGERDVRAARDARDTREARGSHLPKSHNSDARQRARETRLLRRALREEEELRQVRRLRARAKAENESASQVVNEVANEGGQPAGSFGRGNEGDASRVTRTGRHGR